MVSHGYNNQWLNKVIFVGGLIKDQGTAYNMELDVLSCQNGNCTWTASGVSLGTPRSYGIAMAVPELMTCQEEVGVVDYTPAGPPACNTGWIGDTYCDDINNHVDCSYDGGDCCGCSVVTSWCTECLCLDPNESGSGTNCTQTATCTTQWIADGYCDDVNNNVDCSYDGGDCCGCNVNTQWCQECQCLDPNGSGGGTTCPQTTTTATATNPGI